MDRDSALEGRGRGKSVLDQYRSVLDRFFRQESEFISRRTYSKRRTCNYVFRHLGGVAALLPSAGAYLGKFVVEGNSQISTYPVGSRLPCSPGRFAGGCGPY